MLTFRVEMNPPSFTPEADALFLSAHYCRALPLYQQHVNEMYQQTVVECTQLLSSARSYRMLAKCYRYMGQWEYALPALLDALDCIQQSHQCDTSDDSAGRAVVLEQQVHHMLADTYSVLAEEQHSNISNPLRLSRALYHCLVADQLASRLLDAGQQSGEGEECVAAVDASVAVQVSLGCVYRLMAQQAQQQLQHSRLLPPTKHTNSTPEAAETVGEWRWQRHDVLNLEGLSVSELEELIVEWLCEAKAVLNGAIRPLQTFRAHHLLVAICDELHKLYKARSKPV